MLNKRINKWDHWFNDRMVWVLHQAPYLDPETGNAGVCPASIEQVRPSLSGESKQTDTGVNITPVGFFLLCRPGVQTMAPGVPPAVEWPLGSGDWKKTCDDFRVLFVDERRQLRLLDDWLHLLSFISSSVLPEVHSLELSVLVCVGILFSSTGFSSCISESFSSKATKTNNMWTTELDFRITVGR